MSDEEDDKISGFVKGYAVGHTIKTGVTGVSTGMQLFNRYVLSPLLGPTPRTKAGRRIVALTLVAAAASGFGGYKYLYYPMKPSPDEVHRLSSPLFARAFQDIDSKTKEAQLRVTIPELNVRHGAGAWGYVNRSHETIREYTKVVVLKYGRAECEIMIAKSEMTGIEKNKDIFIATVPTHLLTKATSPQEFTARLNAGVVTKNTKYAVASGEISFHDPEQKNVKGPIIVIPEGAPIEIVKPVSGHFYREYTNGRVAVDEPYEVRVPVLAGDKATKIYVVSGRDLLAIDKATFDAKSAAAKKPTAASSAKPLSKDF